MKRFINKVTLMAGAAVVLAALASCHTTRGFGEDLQHLGNEIEETSSEVH